MAAVGAFAVVESPNIVGYASPACNYGWKIYGAQFLSTSGAAANIQDLVVIGNDAEKVYWDADNNFRDKAPHLQIPNRTTPGGTAEKYYFIQDAWYPVEGNDEGATKPGWADGDGSLVMDVTVTPGMAFWIKNQQPTSTEDFTVTTPGQVPDLTASYDNTTPGSGLWFLASCAFPTAPQINSGAVVVSGAPAIYWDADNNFRDTAAHLQVPNRTNPNGSAEKYYYIQDAWYPVEGNDEGATKPGWADGDGSLVTDDAVTLPVGTGFWLKSSTATTVTFHGSAN